MNDEEKDTDIQEETSDEEHYLSSSVFQDIDEFERAILDEASTRDYTSFEITVTLSKDCLLKGARVFMVFEVLDDLGEVIKSLQDVSALVEVEFDYSFTVIFVSKIDSRTSIEK